MSRPGSRYINTGRTVRCLDLVERFDDFTARTRARELAARLRETHWVRVVRLGELSVGVYALPGKAEEWQQRKAEIEKAKHNREGANMRTNQTAPASINVSIVKGGQSARYLELLSLGKHRIRIQIKSDSYRAQCTAQIERWNGETWCEVWSLDAQVMETADSLAYREDGTNAEHFAKDRATLIARACEVLR